MREKFLNQVTLRNEINQKDGFFQKNNHNEFVRKQHLFTINKISIESNTPIFK